MQPRQATPRNQARPTDGHLGAFIAHALGRPWLPWQRYVADVIGEHTPDGRMAYPQVVVTVPRQCGKTTLVMDIALGRALQYRDYRVSYAMQTGHDATKRFRQWFTEVEASALAGHAHPRRSQGSESLTVAATGSYVQAFPPLDGALRGQALDLVIVDEAQQHDEILGRALDSTIVPTFLTRPRRQLVIIGTAGTDHSGFLARHLAMARDKEPGYALLEWGAVDGDDLEAESTWEARHPGLAMPGVDLDALRGARAVMGPAGFAREYLNVWTRTAVRVIDPEAWLAAQLPAETPRPEGPRCFGVDVTPDRSSAVIAVAVAQGTDTIHLEIVQAGPGTDWVTPRLLELQKLHKAPIAVERSGTVGTIADALDLAGADLIPMAARDVANAAGSFTDDIAAHRLQVYPSELLAEAVAGAVKRVQADGNGYTWSRSGSTAPIAPLVAVCAARWGLERLPPNIRPQVYSL